MTKVLKTEHLQSELAGSAFFQPTGERPEAVPSPALPEPMTAARTEPETTQQPPVTEKVVPAAQMGEASAGQPVRMIVQPPGRPTVRRTTTRYAFEFYQDQIETLKRLSLEEKIVGERGSMSEMVREAIDTYVMERLGRTAGQADARTVVRAYARTGDAA